MGYLPIMTFQYYEYEQNFPTDYEQRDFRKMTDAGAVIVSGSQAHQPASMEFRNQTFIHYGLGNLFFDQMFPNSRREFVDRQIFYNGKHISTELLTFLLEDFSQPRPMLPDERRVFLEEIFSASGWR
jgi:poly-gamma-glutamate synthesis protein (capsule biosynthesis protein)